MGWASAGDIFDPVARALVDINADERTKRAVLGPLIKALQDGDWDTEDESLYQFRADPVIVSLFYQRDVGNVIDGNASHEGVIDYDEAAGEWVLRCVDLRWSADPNPRCGELSRRPGASVAGHDDLVRLWADHDRSEHGGNGEVPARMLLDRGADQ